MSTATDPSQTAATSVAAGEYEVVRVHVPRRSVRSELRAIKVVWKRELIRYFSDRLRIVTALVQPLLFLFVLGSGLQQLSAASTDGVDLKTFRTRGSWRSRCCSRRCSRLPRSSGTASTASCAR